MMNPSILSVVYFIAFSHALMLSIALWQRSDSKSAGRLLSLVMAILAYKLFEGGSTYSGFYHYVPHLLDLMPAMVMVLGPLFYGYVRQVTGQTPFRWRHWLMHLAPWIILWVFLNSPSVFRAAELKIAMWDQIVASDKIYGAVYPLHIVFLLIGIKIHLSLYLLFSTLSLQKFSRSVKNIRSDNSGEVLTQLNALAIAFILLEALWVSLFIAQQYFGAVTLGQVSQSWLLFIGIVVLAMGFVGLKQPGIIFTEEERLLIASSAKLSQNQQPTNDEQDKVKYIHSALPDSAADAVAKQIEAALEQQQLYLNDKLTLTDLAKALDLKSHTLSQVINQRMHTNFYKLVNSFRVQHAVNLLENSAINWSIERIALESGFSNRVTFNKAFKEQMDCTASEYKKQLKQAV